MDRRSLLIQADILGIFNTYCMSDLTLQREVLYVSASKKLRYRLDKERRKHMVRPEFRLTLPKPMYVPITVRS